MGLEWGQWVKPRVRAKPGSKRESTGRAKAERIGSGELLERFGLKGGWMRRKGADRWLHVTIVLFDPKKSRAPGSGS